ncbi:MAG: nucleoside deaminase [Patescibacteria group bacterium]
MNDKQFLQKAIMKVKESVAQGGFPAGAIVVKKEYIVGEGVSIGNKLNDPTSHGEIVSIREACKDLKTSDLSGSVLYASMQPCLMCLGAAMWSTIPKIVFACPKERVSEDYYGGHYQMSTSSAEFIRPIELVHLAELEEESLAVVREWERLRKAEGKL